MISPEFGATIAGITLALSSTASMADTAATAHSGANLSYQIQVIDLNPDDGITANVEYTNLGLFSSATIQPNHDWASAKSDRQNGSKSSSAAISSKNHAAFAWGNYESVIASKAYAYDLGSYSSTQSLSSGLNLTPFTGLVITGRASGFANASLDNSSWSSANMSLDVRVAGNWVYRNFGHMWNSYLGDPGSTEYFTLAVYNYSDQSAYGYWSGYAKSNGWLPPPAPIPEPETWAMLAGGLGMLAALQRRRKNKQAEAE